MNAQTITTLIGAIAAAVLTVVTANQHGQIGDLESGTMHKDTITVHIDSLSQRMDELEELVTEYHHEEAQ